MELPDGTTIKSPTTLKTIAYNGEIVWRAGSTVTYDVGQGTGHYVLDNTSQKNVFYIYGLPTLTPQTLDEENNTETSRADFASTNIVRNGYTWAGTWSVAPNNKSNQSPALMTVEGDEENPSYPTRSTGDDFSLYPVWNLNTYRIAYNANKGTGSTDPLMPANKIQYTVEDDAWTLTNPTRTGYQFKGWSGSHLTGDENLEVEIVPSEAVTGFNDRNYTANWDPNYYTVRFNANNGFGEMDDQDRRFDDGVKLTDNAFTRDYYTWQNWNTNTAGTGTSFANRATTNITTENEATVDLYSIWKPINYSISYTLNSGALASGKTNPTSYNVETPAFTLNNPVRNYYDFVGWSGTALTGNSNKTVTIAKGSHDNRSYTANWTPTNYSISYTLNSGALASGKTNPTSYNVETPAFTLNNPSRNYYTFVGWSGTGLSGTGNKTVTVAKGSHDNRSYTANWTPVNYSITYNLNSGALASGKTNPTSYTVETNAFTLNNPSRSYYTFNGWSGTGLSGSTNKTVTVAKGSNGNRAYTANYSPVNYTLTLNPNGGSFASTPSGYTKSGSNYTKSYNVETTAFTLPNNPTKTNYTFTGWTGGSTTTPNKNLTIAKGSHDNITYTANWQVNDLRSTVGISDSKVYNTWASGEHTPSVQFITASTYSADKAGTYTIKLDAYGAGPVTGGFYDGCTARIYYQDRTKINGKQVSYYDYGTDTNKYISAETALTTYAWSSPNGSTDWNSSGAQRYFVQNRSTFSYIDLRETCKVHHEYTINVHSSTGAFPVIYSVVDSYGATTDSDGFIWQEDIKILNITFTAD